MTSYTLLMHPPSLCDGTIRVFDEFIAYGRGLFPTYFFSSSFHRHATATATSSLLYWLNAAPKNCFIGRCHSAYWKLRMSYYIKLIKYWYNWSYLCVYVYDFAPAAAYFITAGASILFIFRWRRHFPEICILAFRLSLLIFDVIISATTTHVNLRFESPSALIELCHCHQKIPRLGIPLDSIVIRHYGL